MPKRAAGKQPVAKGAKGGGAKRPRSSGCEETPGRAVQKQMRTHRRLQVSPNDAGPSDSTTATARPAAATAAQATLIVGETTAMSQPEPGAAPVNEVSVAPVAALPAVGGAVTVTSASGANVTWVGGKGGCRNEVCAGVPLQLRKNHRANAQHVGLHLGCCKGLPGVAGGIGPPAGKNGDPGHEGSCQAVLLEERATLETGRWLI